MTSPVSNAPPVGVPTYDEVAASGLITPQNVMDYCASRLSSLGEMLQSRFDEQSRRNETMKALGRLGEICGRWPSVTEGAKGHNIPEAHRDMANDLANLWNEAPDLKVRLAIQDRYRVVTGRELPVKDGRAEPISVVGLNPEKIKGLSADEWKGVSSVAGLQDGMSTDNELSMIQLQSIVSQRQLAIQLTTQLMASMNESAKTIVQNIR